MIDGDTTAVVRDLRLSPTARIVFLELFGRAVTTRETQVSAMELAVTLGLSIPTVRRALQQLRQVGLISTDPPVWAGRGKAGAGQRKSLHRLRPDGGPAIRAALDAKYAGRPAPEETR